MKIFQQLITWLSAYFSQNKNMSNENNSNNIMISQSDFQYDQQLPKYKLPTVSEVGQALTTQFSNNPSQQEAQKLGEYDNKDGTFSNLLQNWDDLDRFFHSTRKSPEATQTIKKALDQINMFKEFNDNTIKWMAIEAVRVTNELQDKLVILDSNGTIKYSRKDAFGILSLMFFGLTQPQEKYSFNYLINCDQIFKWKTYEGKLKCMLHYFISVGRMLSDPSRAAQLSEMISFSKISRQIDFDWLASNEKLSEICITQGKNEDHDNSIVTIFGDPQFCCYALLSSECAQEEILVLLNPELLVGSLFITNIREDQAVFVKGVYQYNDYTGYERSFRFRPPVGREFDRKQILLSIDALHFPFPNSPQERQNNMIMRELNKAFIGFDLKVQQKHKPDDAEQIPLDIPVSTGKWGCGIFNGNVYLKALIQWIAASQAGRKIIINCCEDNSRYEKLQYYFENLRAQYKTVGELLTAFMKLNHKVTQIEDILQQLIQKSDNLKQPLL